MIDACCADSTGSTGREPGANPDRGVTSHPKGRRLRPQPQRRRLKPVDWRLNPADWGLESVEGRLGSEAGPRRRGPEGLDGRLSPRVPLGRIWRGLAMAEADPGEGWPRKQAGLRTMWRKCIVVGKGVVGAALRDACGRRSARSRRRCNSRGQDAGGISRRAVFANLGGDEVL